MKSSLHCCLVVTLAAGMTASCRPSADIQPNDLRTYTVPRQASPTRTGTQTETSAGASPSPRSAATAMAAAAPGSPSLAYDLPAGWTDTGASGMRLATLRTGPDDAADAGEVTIIPASGTLQSNATRWQEQLTPGANPERVARGIEEGETLTVNGAESTILLLLDDATENQQAILAAMIPLDESTALFVKFKGPAAVARTLRDPFTAFVRSIRWK